MHPTILYPYRSSYSVFLDYKISGTAIIFVQEASFCDLVLQIPPTTVHFCWS